VQAGQVAGAERADKGIVEMQLAYSTRYSEFGRQSAFLLDSNHSDKCFGRTSRKKANQIYDSFLFKKNYDCLHGLNA
jgi:hypothetical protein